MSESSKQVVMRCPKCGSTDAFWDESRSMVDLTYMSCPACGEGGLTDSWERNEDWYTEVELSPDEPFPKFVTPLVGDGFYSELAAVQKPTVEVARDEPAPTVVAPVVEGTSTKPVFGCKSCAGKDSEVAWYSVQNRVRSIVQELHFGVHIARCACSQMFVVVFTERVDWNGGEDSQTWMVVPLTANEADSLNSTQLKSTITALGQQRRFLVRSLPSGGTSTWWRDGGLMIGPHD